MKHIMALCNLIFTLEDGEPCTLFKGVIAEVTDEEADRLVAEALAVECTPPIATTKDKANGKPKAKNSGNRAANKRGGRKNISKN